MTDKSNYFMKIARETAKLSTCIKKDVGAVLVKYNRILSVGYNGAPNKVSHCTKETCLRTLYRDNQNPEICRGVHAEANTLIQCAIHGLKIEKGATLYCTHFPCMSCIKLLINAGIERIVFENEYEMDNIEKFKILSETTILIKKFTKFGNYNCTRHFDQYKHLKILEKEEKNIYK